jgi:hypothetical protein
MIREECSAPPPYLVISGHYYTMQVEETQFQQYASKVVDEVQERGGPLKPLVAAAKEGAGTCIP